jgi:hypothetical protein
MRHLPLQRSLGVLLQSARPFGYGIVYNLTMAQSVFPVAKTDKANQGTEIINLVN